MNPYMNPYMQQYAAPQPIPQRQVDKVNGRNGAMQYQIGPNSQAWILDESGMISWLIITDSAGYRTATPYDVSPHQDTPEPDYGTLAQRISRLEEIVNGYATANTPAARKKQFAKPDDGTD